MKSFTFLLTILGMLASGFALRAEGQGDEVVVVYNTKEPESKDVAEHYAKMRHVPARQVLGFPMPAREEISRTDFRDRLEKPITRALSNLNLLQFGSQTVLASNGVPQHLQQNVTQAKIRYLVLCYGVPLRISEDAGIREPAADSMIAQLHRNEAAVDSELACLPILDKNFLLAGPFLNPLHGCTNANLLNPTNGLLMVARLDGPNAAIARALVDKAIQAETDGLWGRAYFDLRGITNGEYQIGDNLIRTAAEAARRFGFETIVDSNWSTFPVSFPLSQAAYYVGWYDENASGPFTRPTIEFMPGAFAYHLHSFSAATLRTKDRQWVGPFLARGVTATMGCVAEPYLAGTPDVATFTARFLYSGFSFGEAAYSGQSVLSWQTTVVGDPLYRPFARSPQDRHNDLEHRHSQLIEWSFLRLINFKILNGTPLSEVALAIENLEITSHSAVLQEKLADLYTQLGKPSASIHALRQAIKLSPTPEQRVRLMLALADRLVASQQDAEAYDVYQEFLKVCPDYPDQTTIHKYMDDLAQKLGRSDDSKSTNRAPAPPAKVPPLRRGI